VNHDLSGIRRRVPFAVGVPLVIAGLLCLGALPLGVLVGSAGANPVLAPAPGTFLSAPPSQSPLSMSSPLGRGPHPGTLEIWEATGGAPSTMDPAQCYYSVCDEPITNVYESLIAFNGTLTGPTADQFVPQVATCVPGSNLCLSQFGGNDLIYPNLTTGAPQYYTFEIDQNAHFYDPVTNVGWPVYPSDVLFTFARTMGWSDLPFEQATNGKLHVGRRASRSAQHHPGEHPGRVHHQRHELLSDLSDHPDQRVRHVQRGPLGAGLAVLPAARGR
jgi:ABC-type transport system substrate-binding protein